MSTEAESASSEDANITKGEPLIITEIPKPTWNPRPVLATTYSFPSLEPLRFVEYPRNKLYLPLRKDLLHRAVVYEGDKTRQGTASSKWRGDVHGSGRKLYPQKGTGHARAGDKKSPVRVGGGVAHGPHPRDFSTKLPRKIYDQAWRTALSYRYRRGELIIIDGKMEMPEDGTPHFAKALFKTHDWYASTVVTDVVDSALFGAVAELGLKTTRILDRADVDVKNLLERKRLIIEKEALDNILKEHCRDLVMEPARARY